jgi:hypothetical protein
MLARVHDSLGLELHLADVFERPTIRRLAVELSASLFAEADDADLEGLLSELEEEQV